MAEKRISVKVQQQLISNCNIKLTESNGSTFLAEIRRYDSKDVAFVDKHGRELVLLRKNFDERFRKGTIEIASKEAFAPPDKVVAESEEVIPDPSSSSVDADEEQETFEKRMKACLRNFYDDMYGDKKVVEGIRQIVEEETKAVKVKLAADLVQLASDLLQTVKAIRKELK